MGITVTKDIEDAVTAFEKGDINGTIQGLHDIGDVLSTIGEDIKLCTSSKDMAELEKLINMFE